MHGTDDKLEGVEIEILSKMIELLRERYSAASYALTYLETMSLEYDLVGLANQRDVLSHFATICNPSKSRKEREESLTGAEEHLRRAIIEPYQTAMEAKLAQFIDDYEDYEKNILKKERLAKLDKITDHEYVRKEIEAIKKLEEEARNKKNCNIWNKEWEDSVKCFTSAYERISSLHNLLSSYKRQYYNAMERRRLLKWSTIIAVGVTILAAFLFSPVALKIAEYLFGK